jgi:hypothetical protein
MKHCKVEERKHLIYNLVLEIVGQIKDPKKHVVPGFLD